MHTPILETLRNSIQNFIFNFDSMFKSIPYIFPVHEQKAHITCHFISECTWNTYDTFPNAKENDLPGMVLHIDFENI